MLQKGGALEAVRVSEIPLANLHPPGFHPFQVNDDESMCQLCKSVKLYGVREPGLARPRAEGGYELIAGNRRRRACELAGISTLPVIIREMDDSAAAIAMVDSNLMHRETILPSEKAWAYRVKLEALNHNGIKGDAHSVDVLVAQTGESRNQIYRFVRLTELIAALIDKVDAQQLALSPAVELSYLSITEQTAVADAMSEYEVKPSFSQAVRLKKLKQSGELTIGIIYAILSESKRPPKGEATGSARYRRYFPPEYSPKQIDEVIINLLSEWSVRTA